MAWGYEDDKRVASALMRLLGLVTGAFIHQRLKVELGMEEEEEDDYEIPAHAMGVGHRPGWQKVACENNIGLEEMMRREETLPNNVIPFPGSRT